MKHLAASCFAGLLFISGCTTPMNSGSQCTVDPAFFNTMSTFAWRTTDSWTVKDDTGFVSPIIEQQLRNRFVKEMASKGFREIAEPNDETLRVAVSLITRRELQSFDVDANNCPDCWEPVAPSSNVRMTLRTIGFLAFDVYSDGRPVWRSWVERVLYPEDRDKAADVLEQAVPKLLSEFPPTDTKR